MKLGQVASLSNRGAPERCFTRIGFGVSLKYKTRLERLAKKDEHSSFLTSLRVPNIYFVTLTSSQSYKHSSFSLMRQIKLECLFQASLFKVWPKV
jgi:hypothetical protein